MPDKKVNASLIYKEMSNSINKAIKSKNSFIKKLSLILKAMAKYIGDTIALIIYGRKVFKIVDKEEEKKSENANVKNEEKEENKNIDKDISEDIEKNNEIPAEPEISTITEEDVAFIEEFQTYINDTLGASLNIDEPFEVQLDKDNIEIKNGNMLFKINRTTRNSFIDNEADYDKEQLTCLCTLMSGAYCSFSDKKNIKFEPTEDLIKDATYILPYFLEEGKGDCTFYVNGIKINYVKEHNQDANINVEASYKSYNSEKQNKIIVENVSYDINHLDVDLVRKDFLRFAERSQSISANNFNEFILSDKRKANIIDSYIQKECSLCFPEATLNVDIKSGNINVVIITNKDEELSFSMNKNREIVSDLPQSENKLLQKCIEKCFSDFYSASDIMPSQNQLRKSVRNAVSTPDCPIVTICGTKFQVIQEKDKFFTISPIHHNEENAKYTFNKNNKDELIGATDFVMKHIEHSIIKNGSSFDDYKNNFINNRFEIHEELNEEKNLKYTSKEESER